MKKHILTIVVALGLTASISAQDSYYYCSGDKVLLTEHSTKVVAMAPKGNSFSLPFDTTKTYGTWNERYGYGLVDAYNAVINTPRN